MANKVLIENDIGIFQIPIEKLEEFKGMLIDFYESGDDREIIEFMKANCIRRVTVQPATAHLLRSWQPIK